MVENQRARLLVGIVRAISKRGYNQTTITQIAEAAAVSRHTFYDNFQNKEQGFLAAYDHAYEDVSSAMQSAAEPFDDWHEQVKAALAALLEFFAAEPDLARFFWLEPIGGGATIADRYREVMHSLAEQLTANRPAITNAPPLSAIAEEAIVGGVVALIAKQISAGRPERLPDLLPDLLELILAPYLGSAEAERHAGHSS